MNDTGGRGQIHDISSRRHRYHDSLRDVSVPRFVSTFEPVERYLQGLLLSVNKTRQEILQSTGVAQ